jgi:hypothetical protein
MDILEHELYETLLFGTVLVSPGQIIDVSSTVNKMPVSWIDAISSSEAGVFSCG